MVGDGGELVESQRVAASSHALTCLGVPVRLELGVAGGEIGGQRRIDHDVEIFPGDAAGRQAIAVAVDDVFEFVQQLLGAADAEGRDQQRAAIAEGVLAQGLQALATVFAAFVHAVAIGAFDDDDIGRQRRLRRRQQRRVGGAQIARKDHPLLVAEVLDIEFDIGRAEDVASRLQANPQAGRAGDHRLPLLVWQRHQLLAQKGQKFGDQGLVAGEADFQRIFEHHRQQQRRWLAAIDRPLETGGQQIRDAADVVDVHMGDDQGAQLVDRERHLELVGPGAVGRGLSALEQAAIDQHRLPVGQVQLMARPGHTAHRAVVGEADVHGVRPVCYAGGGNAEANRALLRCGN